MQILNTGYILVRVQHRILYVIPHVEPTCISIALFVIPQVISGGVGVTEALAVDWVGRNIYWTEYVLETVEVASMDGAHRTVLFSQNVTNPRAIVLDPSAE